MTALEQMATVADVKDLYDVAEAYRGAGQDLPRSGRAGLAMPGRVVARHGY